MDEDLRNVRSGKMCPGGGAEETAAEAGAAAEAAEPDAQMEVATETAEPDAQMEVAAEAAEPGAQAGVATEAAKPGAQMEVATAATAAAAEMTAVDDCQAVSLDEYFERIFHLPARDYTQYSPLTLAYIGDAVFDVVIRTIVVKHSNMPASKLHIKTSSIVKAPAQAEIMKALQPYLTKEEESVYRRGRNAQPYNTAKNATRREYLEATGFEAMIGYLYLQRSYQRMLDLIRRGMDESGLMPG